MKTKVGILILTLCTMFFSSSAQRVVTTTRAVGYDISDNLDLDAVASIFGESANLADFEHRLNNPDNHISNLDLNQDGYIDYLRVLENSSERNSLVIIQAILDDNVFQDVATIEIERVPNGNHRVQIVGDEYLYGPDYIIEPVFVRTPLIFSFFWGSFYEPWHSPYYWGYYPSWYRYYRPYPTFRYHRHINVYINWDNAYHRSHDRTIHFSRDFYIQNRRNDYANQHPDRSFERRHEGFRNKQELHERRSTDFGNYRRNAEYQRPASRQVQENRSINSGRNEEQRNVYQNRRSTYGGDGSSQRQTQPQRREIDTENSHQKNSDNSERTIQRRSTGDEQNSKHVSRDQSTTRPEKSANQVESTKRSPASIQKPNEGPTRNRSRVVERSEQRNVRKSEAPTREPRKESQEKKRTE